MRLWSNSELPALCTRAQGMARAYRILLRMLERQYGGVEAVQPPATGKATGSGSTRRAGSKGGGAANGASTLAVGADGTAAGQAGAAEQAAGGEGLNISALLQSPQINAAAFLAMIVVMAIVWR